MKPFKVRIIEADNTFYDGEMTSLVVPGVDGEYGVLANHQNLAIAIVPGMISFRDEEDAEMTAFVSDGMMRVEDGEVLLLVDSAEWPDEIDLERARSAEDRARERIANKAENIDLLRAEVALKKALVRQDLKA